MNIKTWFTKNATGTKDTLNLQITALENLLEYDTIMRIKEKVVESIADKFLQENGEVIKKDILKNKNFADSVYNAIVLKKSEKIINN
jgi:hypothetical protein